MCPCAQPAVLGVVRGEELGNRGEASGTQAGEAGQLGERYYRTVGSLGGAQRRATADAVGNVLDGHAPRESSRHGPNASRTAKTDSELPGSRGARLSQAWDVSGHVIHAIPSPMSRTKAGDHFSCRAKSASLAGTRCATIGASPHRERSEYDLNSYMVSRRVGDIGINCEPSARRAEAFECPRGATLLQPRHVRHLSFARRRRGTYCLV